MLRLLPRGQLGMPEPVASELAPPPQQDCMSLIFSAGISSATGQILSVRVMSNARANLAMQIGAARGVFLLKAARGAYRARELETEHTAMLELARGPVPVPAALLCGRATGMAYLLRPMVPGEPAGAVLASGGPEERLHLFDLFGRTLRDIHSVAVPSWTWSQWLEHSLTAAGANLRCGALLDSSEFESESSAESVLSRLRRSRPAPGEVVLLHGDFRPKNLIWQAGRIVSVVDWGFADFGDPYYDLAIMLWYAQTQEERAAFLSAYGTDDMCEDRLAYCTALSNFLNI